MKKYLLLFAVVFMPLNGCRKSVSDIVGVSASNSISIAVADTTKGYQPVTATSFLKYVITTNGVVSDTLTNTMLGVTTIINGKTYNSVSSRSHANGTVDIDHLSNINHVYTVRDNTSISGLATEILYLKDNVAVGTTWTVPFTDNGTLNAAPAQMIGTVIEKSISKTISNKIYNNVIHTTAVLQHDVGSGFISYGTYDFYIAKGIGIIELDAVIGFPGVPTINTTETLADYAIK